MKDEIVVPVGMKKKEWFTPQEFADGVGVSRRSLAEWIRVHPDFKKSFCQTIGGGSKPRILILWKGVAQYISMKGRNSKIPGTLALLDKAKSGVAEKANEAIEKSQKAKFSTVPLMTPEAMMLEAARMLTALSARLDNAAAKFSADHEKLERVEEAVARIEEKMNEPLEITSIHRQYLNDRVRYYAVKTNIHYPTVWRAINTHTGRGAVSFYEFKDFQNALKYLKGMYEQANLSWK